MNFDAYPIDTRMSPSFHPSIITKCHGYNDETAHNVDSTKSVLGDIYMGLRSIMDARDAIYSNTSLTEDAQHVQMIDVIEKGWGKKLFPKLQSHFKTLGDSVIALDKQLSEPLKAKAVGSLGAEIRNYVRGLSLSERETFLSNAVKGNDEVSATAVLGAPAYLSGMTPEMQRLWTRSYHEAMNPQLMLVMKMKADAEFQVSEYGKRTVDFMNKLMGPGGQKKAQAIRERMARTDAAVKRASGAF